MATEAHVKFSAGLLPKGLGAVLEHEKTIWRIVEDRGTCSRAKIEFILQETCADMRRQLDSTTRGETLAREGTAHQLELYEYCLAQLAAILSGLLERGIIVTVQRSE